MCLCVWIFKQSHKIVRIIEDFLISSILCMFVIFKSIYLDCRRQADELSKDMIQRIIFECTAKAALMRVSAAAPGMLGAAGMCGAAGRSRAELECCVVEEDWQSGQSYTAQWHSLGLVPQQRNRSETDRRLMGELLSRRGLINGSFSR